MKRFLPYLINGALLCLTGCAFYYLSRKRFLKPSSELSEALETELEDLRSWKRTAQSELESQFDRIRSIAGRLDRYRRKEPTSQEPQGEAQEAPNDLDDQGKLNRLLAQRFHGGV